MREFEREHLSVERLHYLVVNHLGSWKVKFHGRHYGPYPSQEEATRIAIAAAQKAAEAGKLARVLVQQPDEHFTCAWSTGQAGENGAADRRGEDSPAA